MSKLFFLCLLSSLLISKTIVAKTTVVCCPTKDLTDGAYAVMDSGKTALMRFMYQNGCTIVSKGNTVERIGVSFSMIQITNFYGKFWCPREIN